MAQDIPALADMIRTPLAGAYSAWSDLGLVYWLRLVWPILLLLTNLYVAMASLQLGWLGRDSV